MSNILDQKAAESNFQSEDDFYSEEIDKYCHQCGEVDNFAYIRTTAASSLDKCTRHFELPSLKGGDS